MIRFFAKLFSSVFGMSVGDEKKFSSQTCPECGSKLMRTAGRDELHKSQAESLTLANDGDLCNRDSCNSSLRNENANWLCPNPDCPAQVRRWLAHWCAPEVMDVPGADTRLIALLVERGLARDVAELYRIKVKELAALPGMNAVAAQKIFDALSSSLKRDAWRLLSGLNIPLVGAVEAQALGKGFPTVDSVFAAGVPRLMQDAGVSEAVAQSLVCWHSDGVNRKLVRRLNKARLNFRSELHRP